MASIPSFKEGEDVEEFLLTAERRLTAGEIPEKDWLTTLASKLSGKTGSMWQDLCATCDNYQEVKTRLLNILPSWLLRYFLVTSLSRSKE